MALLAQSNIMVPKHKNIKFHNIDKLTYAGKIGNLKKIRHLNNYSFSKLDICNFNKVINYKKI